MVKPPLPRPGQLLTTHDFRQFSSTAIPIRQGFTSPGISTGGMMGTVMMPSTTANYYNAGMLSG